MKKSKILALVILVLGIIYLLVSLSLVIGRSSAKNSGDPSSQTGEDTASSPTVSTPDTHGSCTHLFSAEWYHENDEHFHKCLTEGCDATDTKISCSGGQATCAEKAICQFCSSPYGAVAEHEWSTEWDCLSELGHANKCLFNCGEHSEILPHVPGPDATETSPQTCIDCGFIIASATSHVHSTEAIPMKSATCTAFGNIEYFTCTGCSKLFFDSAASQEISDSDSVLTAPLGHDFSEATCTAPQTCQRNDCGATLGSALGHTPTDAWSSNSGAHWQLCSTCGESLNQAPHIPGPAATEQAHQICTVCKYVIVPKLNHTHTLSKIPAKNPTCTAQGSIEHFICSGCSKIFSEASAENEISGASALVLSPLGHNYAPATCTAPKTCQRNGCGATEGSSLGHTPSGNWNANQTSHWHLCSVCGARLNQSSHTPGPAATEQAPQSCTKCGYIIAPKLEHVHKYNSDPQSDVSNHWYVCNCGHIGNKQAHKDGNKNLICDTCQYQLPPPESSKLEDILGPAQITLLRPVASGVLTKSNASAIIDYSNFKDGYVMVKYTVDTSIRLKVQVQGPTTTYTYNIIPQEWTVFPLSDGNGNYAVKVFKNVVDNKYSVALSLSFTAELDDEFAPFLRPNQYVNFENAVSTMNKAAELTASKTDTLDKVKAIYTYIINTLTYDYEKAATVQSGYLPDLDQVLAAKKGICFDYAALMAGMLRSQNIACKLVVGYANTEYHAWISVFSPDKGWVDGAIFFDGVKWQLMDPTFASSSSSGSAIINKVNYTSKYIY